MDRNRFKIVRNIDVSVEKSFGFFCVDFFPDSEGCLVLCVPDHKIFCMEAIGTFAGILDGPVIIQGRVVNLLPFTKRVVWLSEF